MMDTDDHNMILEGLENIKNEIINNTQAKIPTYTQYEETNACLGNIASFLLDIRQLMTVIKNKQME